MIVRMSGSGARKQHRQTWGGTSGHKQTAIQLRRSLTRSTAGQPASDSEEMERRLQSRGPIPQYSLASIVPESERYGRRIFLKRIQVRETIDIEQNDNTKTRDFKNREDMLPF